MAGFVPDTDPLPSLVKVHSDPELGWASTLPCTLSPAQNPRPTNPHRHSSLCPAPLAPQSRSHCRGQGGVRVDRGRGLLDWPPTVPLTVVNFWIGARLVWIVLGEPDLQRIQRQWESAMTASCKLAREDVPNTDARYLLKVALAHCCKSSERGR